MLEVVSVFFFSFWLHLVLSKVRKEIIIYHLIFQNAASYYHSF